MGIKYKNISKFCKTCVEFKGNGKTCAGVSKGKIVYPYEDCPMYNEINIDEEEDNNK